ncbi:hypothetical protein, partial [Duganella sp. OV510]|uniref:hypothetical protein n=1 Tax=Duganella sp. OV510 TaxID=1881039 RepID=UPI001C31A1CD
TAGHWFALLKNTDSISTEYFFVEHLMLFVAAPNAHTYRLLIFKDHSVLLAEEAFCSSAKRQDYEALQPSRQALLFSRFALYQIHRFARDRIIPRHPLV